jgi:hypothetical protein
LIIGLVFLGIVAGSVTVPIILELAIAVKGTIGSKPGTSKKKSALFTIFSSLGIMLSILIGGTLF